VALAEKQNNLARFWTMATGRACAAEGTYSKFSLGEQVGLAAKIFRARVLFANRIRRFAKRTEPARCSSLAQE